MHSRLVVVCSALLAATLTALTAVGLWSVREIRDHTERVGAAVGGLSAWQDVQRALAEEAFAEAGYRRSPRPATRVRLERAVAELGTSVADVRALRSERDDGTTTYLLALNQRYSAEVEAALRTGSTPAGTTVDDRVAGPGLDAMQQLVDAAVGRRQRDAIAALEAQRMLDRRLLVVAALSMVTATSLVALCWVVLVRRERWLSGEAAVLEHRSQHDPLTGLGNRVLLHERLALELARDEPDVAVLLIDLDGFKLVNDTFGHATGDEVLVDVARRLRAAVRDDDLAVRLGGDEFAVVCSGRVAESLAERLRQRLPLPVVDDGQRLHVGASVGSAVGGPGGSPQELLARADRDLYAAKRLAHERMPQDLPRPRADHGQPAHTR